jgi:hypothetical protein
MFWNLTLVQETPTIRDLTTWPDLRERTKSRRGGIARVLARSVNRHSDTRSPAIKTRAWSDHESHVMTHILDPFIAIVPTAVTVGTRIQSRDDPIDRVRTPAKNSVSMLPPSQAIAIVIAAVTAEIPSGTYNLSHRPSWHTHECRAYCICGDAQDRERWLSSEERTSQEPVIDTRGFQKVPFTRVYKCLKLAKSVQDSAKNWELRLPFQTGSCTPYVVLKSIHRVLHERHIRLKNHHCTRWPRVQ